MPMNMQARYESASDPAFLSRVRQAIWQQAQWILSASADDKGYLLAEFNHPNHVDRVILARIVIRGELETGIDPIVMARNILSMPETTALDGVLIEQLSDEILVAYVQMNWDKFIH